MDERSRVQEVTARIPAARKAVAGAVYRTPLEPAPWLSAASGGDISLKLECYQPTGSFKVRGAVSAIGLLDAEARSRGIITASAGNHGLGIAYAAERAGVQATILVPENVSSAKLHALRRFPAEVRIAGPDYDAAEQEAIRLARASGRPFISAYNDLAVMAGQGTIGPELLEDVPELEVVIVPVGGGGLIGGVGAWLKAIRPAMRVIGVQPEASPSMARALEAGHLVPIPIAKTLADGLAGNIQPGSLTFDLARVVADEMVLVTEREIERTITDTFREMHLAVEGAAAAGMAALLSGRCGGLEGRRTAIIVTGRNIAPERIRDLLA